MALSPFARLCLLSCVGSVGSMGTFSENDYPPGYDMFGDILEGPKGSERVEFELFNRLAMQADLA